MIPFLAEESRDDGVAEDSEALVVVEVDVCVGEGDFDCGSGHLDGFGAEELVDKCVFDYGFDFGGCGLDVEEGHAGELDLDGAEMRVMGGWRTCFLTDTRSRPSRKGDSTR